MAQVFRMLASVTGLNTKVDPVRLEYDPKTGVEELSVAYNVDIDNTGRVGRRKGFTKQVAVASHSLFCDGGACLFVTGDALCILHPDYTYTALRNVRPGVVMRCCQVDDTVYYLNGWEIGRVLSGLSVSWTMADAADYGPDTKKEFSDPPIGTDVEYFDGRMWIAEGDTAWYSESYGFNLFNLTEGYFKFDSKLRMIRAVRDGIYFSTEGSTWFFRGRGNPKDFVKVKVTDYPVVQYTDKAFHGKIVFPLGENMYIDIKSGELSGIWMAEKGICYGGYDGTFRNLTEDKLVLPKAITGSGLVYNGKYVGLLNP